MSLTREQRANKKARKLMLALTEVSEYEAKFRDEVLTLAVDLLKQNGLYLASEGALYLREGYRDLENL